MYDPHERPSEVYLKFWGTRGSIPVSGPAYSSFGGSTCCLEIRNHDDLILIDAGTGIRPLGEEMMGRPQKEAHLFFGHTHWDHIIGFPFFHPLYDPNFTLHIYTLEKTIRDVKGAITRVLSPEYFPVRFEDIRAKLIFHEVSPSRSATIGNLTISVVQCDHPGGALGFRIDGPERSIGYVTDNEFMKGFDGCPSEVERDHPLIEPYLDFVDFYKGVSLMIHEAQYTPQHYPEKIGWGHSSISTATAFIKLLGVDKWIVTHHDPVADDEEMQHRLRLHWTVLEDCGLDVNVSFAYDGLMLTA